LSPSTGASEPAAAAPAAAAPAAVLRRQRALIIGTLVVLAAAAWVVVLGQASEMDHMEHMGHDPDLVMGMAAPLFLAIWVAMMAAMMFPAAAPMVLAFARTQASRRARGRPYVPTALFLSAYLVVWLAFGALAYLLAIGAEAVAEDSMWLMDNGGRVAGALVALAGLYQLSPIKDVCLSRCRSPLSFMLSYWRDGPAGAVRMGVRHGVYCLGCCWMLFIILVPIGLMNVAAMAAVTVLVFAEKALPLGREVKVAAAFALVAYGLVAMLVPAALPTVF
jgi:predicted metal-binding membrane protein